LENTEKEFSPEESLRIISAMIETTKNSIRDKSHYFLLWGWAVLLACIAQFYLRNIAHYHAHYLVWWITPFVLMIHIFWIVRERKKEKVKTFIDEASNYLWTALGLSFFVLSFINTRAGWEYSYSSYMMLYGIGTYVSGSLIKFKPLIWGGLLCFPITILSTLLGADYQILLLALAILVSYLIPGYLLRAKFRKGNLHAE